MIDYSFLRLKDNIHDALDIQDPSIVTHYFYNPIQLLPNKTYLQITNVDGGISLDSDCEIFVVDCNDKIIADVTNRVFIEEFTDSNGNNQCKIEFVNLNVDFYRQTVLLKFDMLTSNAVFYTNPINITSYQSERTVFFKYKNYDDFLGIGYTNANVWQSISVAMYFDIPIDETETEDYFQISKNNTISARALRKIFEQYKIEQINRFTFDRLNALLKHELIYIEDIRVTNKPTASSSERLGDSNYFETDLLVAKDYTDISPYEFQVFEGLTPVSFNPFGLYVTGTQFEDFGFIIKYNVPITIGSGSISIYRDNGTLVQTLTTDDAELVNAFQIGWNVTSYPDLETPSNDIYYVTVTGGLVQFGDILSDAITDNTTWTFELRNADYDISDYNSGDYFAN